MSIEAKEFMRLMELSDIQFELTCLAVDGYETSITQEVIEAMLALAED